MKHNKVYKILVISVIIFALIGGYFALRHFGFFQKKQVAVTQSINSIQQEAGQTVQSEDAVENLEQAEIISDQTSSPADKLPAVSDVIKDRASAPVEKKIIEPTKPTETKGDVGKNVDKFVSWGFQKSSGRTIKAIIIHTSYNNIGGDVFDFDKVIQEWKDAGVSPHYAIDRDGTIYHLVADNNIAWHAGASKLPDGTTDVNGASIGIEVINSQDSKFTDDQYSALNSLIASLKKKYEIKYILGHDEIAPGRKTDPWNIDWKKVNR